MIPPTLRQVADVMSSVSTLFADIEPALRDSARFRWLLPIVSGADDEQADQRAQTLAAGLMLGHTGVALVDWAMSECPA